MDGFRVDGHVQFALVCMGSAVAYTKHNFEAGYKTCMRDRDYCVLEKVKLRPSLLLINP